MLDCISGEVRVEVVRVVGFGVGISVEIPFFIFVVLLMVLIGNVVVGNDAQPLLLCREP